MTDKEYLKSAQQEIAAWEKEGPSWLSQVGDFILWPAQKAAEALIPEGFQEAVGKAVQGFLEGLSNASDFTVNREDISCAVQRYLAGRTDLSARLEACDKKAKECWRWNVGVGIAEGGATGTLGLPGLAANIPALFTVTLRTLQEIAACYGYDTRKPEEQEYMFHILRTGSTGDIKAKVEFLIMLKQIEQILIRVTWKKMSADLAAKEISQLSLLAAIRAFAKTLGVQITKRKALQSVPIIGAIVGASFDGTFINDIGRASYMCYRRRFLDENLKASD